MTFIKNIFLASYPKNYGSSYPSLGNIPTPWSMMHGSYYNEHTSPIYTNLPIVKAFFS
jgi:hypothetical protein